VQGISDIITVPGVINRDFADVKTTMAGMGYSVMGTAVRSGDGRARTAAVAAMASPLLEAGAIHGAKGILINITGSSGLKLSEVNEASSIIQEAAHEDANIIFGAVLDESMGDAVKFTVIATGFRDDMPARRERMMAGSTLPTARHDAPPRIVTRPLAEPPIVAPPIVTRAAEPEPVVAVQAPEPEPVPEVVAQHHAEPEPVAAPPVVERAPFASEAVAEEMEAFGWEPPVEKAPEPVAEPPAVEEAPRQSYPTSSYYEAARQQAWHEPAHVEAPRGPVEPAIAYGEPEPVRAYAPVVVEHIAPQPPAEPELMPVKASVFDDDFFRQPKPEPPVSENRWPEAKVPSFAGYTADAPAAETDELDIPAFLRRNH